MKKQVTTPNTSEQKRDNRSYVNPMDEQEWNEITNAKGTFGVVAPTQVETHEPGKRLYPDSWEMNFWNRYFGWFLFGNNVIGRAIGFIFVTPLTNLTGLSLYYQLYLNEIFHTHFMTRLAHFVLMPLINFFLMVFLCQFNFSEQYLWINAGTAMTVYLMLWYLVWGLTQNATFLGLFMAPALSLLCLSANLFYNFFRHDDGQSQAFYDSTVIYTNPLLWVIFCGMLQSGSHSFEPKLPPRVNHTQDRWVGLHDFIERGFKQHRGFQTIGTLVAAFLFGTMDEIIASPRLFPLNVLKVTYMLGYKPEQWAQIQLLAKKSMEFGNPALDYIGQAQA
ncbi:hypothetical protein PPL_00342 [Heterostelium album PN500]|uniref:Uncharacterized protein n=1 Tax=Heterostelium pallidum (strain ATCC 26659 / Pp 5 / PN500) TaxID=670386 RepID=D3AW70_HETP5|nr:hypothetical protein PPL_00342 [Heterostelium album PN500]EFA86543.1 hypothetical protein PPL_00342 [Heterostelium album PN500]|eukprot:XP_020438648.1 hypothetical protein PPL_00342 [Heterostelium album PN500]